MDYSSAGVDIEAGDRFARYIASIESPALRGGIGGFAGALALDLSGVPDPVLLSTTDGVGTKLLVAERMRQFDTIGIDLVDMCVNDLAVCGAAPLQFLDYIACGRISSTPLNEIMDGIVRGCERAGCALSGGETAEMPDVYAPGSFDLAGFCTGVVSRARMLPQPDRIKPGDIVYGIPSTGVHSNGLSLARKALSDAPAHIYEQLLEPTRIYVSELEFLTQHPAVLAAAHITGGGLFGNLTRVLPD
ncbi:MAG: phosphoribosylformylglycinamidine cyclo-ligase, partial [Spirochaetota bacterium]